MVLLDREGFALGVDPEAIVAEEIDFVVSFVQTVFKKVDSLGVNGNVAFSGAAEERPIFGGSPIFEALVISDFAVVSVIIVNSNPILSVGIAVDHLDLDLERSVLIVIVAGTDHFHFIRAVIPVDGVVRRHFCGVLLYHRYNGLRFNTDGLGC